MSTVLIIEDDLFISDLYKRTLSQGGFNVLTALDGEQGVELSLQKPDIVLLDIMMPKMHGIDVLKKLKENPVTQNIPVVLLTNLGNERIIKEAFKLGAKGYFLKLKISPYELVDEVKQFIVDPNKTMDVNKLELD